MYNIVRFTTKTENYKKIVNNNVFRNKFVSEKKEAKHFILSFDIIYLNSFAAWQTLSYVYLYKKYE